MERREKASSWFIALRDRICDTLEQIEQDYASIKGVNSTQFARKKWDRPGGGGGEMSIMHGNVFEKVGVNISTVFGEFDEKFAKEIPGTDLGNRNFFATGISLVAHPKSPLVPIVHFNTRYITTQKDWFGGGGDLTPVFPNKDETDHFHNSFKNACDKFNPTYYPKFKKDCDEYFFIKHRNEPRGVGGIFYDYLNTGKFEEDFAFTREVGLAFLDTYPYLVKKNYMLEWNEAQKQKQLKKRGRYVEFNLVYDRGTRFGLMTNGNVEAILMSLPPLASWHSWS